MNHRLNCPSSHHSRPSSKNQSFSYPTNRTYREDDDCDDDEYVAEVHESDNNEDSDDAYHTIGESKNSSFGHPKKRRLDTYNVGYEFASRSASNSQRIWTEHSTCALLEIWGARFLQLGRCSLRNDDWSEVAERVSEATRMNFGVGDCRNRLNVLKDKYKKEKAKLEGLGGGNSKWPYFKRMDMLMTISPRQEQQCGLACGVDSGEFVFLNPRVYLDHSNVLDEMRDSPGNSCSEGEEEEEEDGGNSARGKGRFKGDGSEESESYRMLSESMKKVGEIYEKIENTKRQHMMELERVRMEFQRELELQKKEMMERMRVEIAKISEEDSEDNDCSAESVSD